MQNRKNLFSNENITKKAKSMHKAKLLTKYFSSGKNFRFLPKTPFI